MKKIILTFWVLLTFLNFAQDFTYFSIGDTSDVAITGTGGVCIMGGGTEDDTAMQWFLNKAQSGNVLVLRASGSDGYQDYFYNQLGVNLAAVETLVMNNANCGSHPFVLDRISKADAIWFAGGDQFLYKSYLKGTAAEDLINEHINVENQVIGGTSAGMAIQGEYYFDAQNGTISSQTALNNPFDQNLTLDNNFLENDYLTNLITDTHFDSPDRKGRISTFLARLVNDNQERVFAIACEEYTAICIENNGIATVYGGYPEYDDKVYFIQTNCEGYGYPEVIEAGQPLTYTNNQKALHVLEMQATTTGTATFDLTDWVTSNGGNWQNWYVSNGQLFETSGQAPNCTLSSSKPSNQTTLNYSVSESHLLFNQICDEIILYSTDGKVLRRSIQTNQISISGLEKGLILVHAHKDDTCICSKWFNY